MAICLESSVWRRPRELVATFAGLALFLVPQSALATDCSPSKNFLGMEWVATDGPEPGTGRYHYYQAPIRCQGGQIVFEPNVGATDVMDAGWKLPQEVIDTPGTTFGTYTGYRMFRNSCGTNLIFIHGSFSGSIGGKSVALYPVSNTVAYPDVLPGPVYLQLGANIANIPDPVTSSCVLSPDSGLNAGMCIPGVDNGIGSASDNGTNPINPAWRGNKIKAQTDYRGAGEHPLAFVRIYNSRATRIAGLTDGFDSAITGRWTHTHRLALGERCLRLNRSQRRPGRGWAEDHHQPEIPGAVLRQGIGALLQSESVL